MPGRVAKPLRQHQLKTILLRVPSQVWPLVSTGKVTEFRAATGNAPQLWRVPLPTLAVAYRRSLSIPRYDYRLLLLEDVRQEALGTISEEGLARAGYDGPDALARFRRDWMIAEKKRFQPLRKVFVYRVRPTHQEDLSEVGRQMIHHLYDDFLNAADTTRSVHANGHQ